MRSLVPLIFSKTAFSTVVPCSAFCVVVTPAIFPAAAELPPEEEPVERLEEDALLDLCDAELFDLFEELFEEDPFDFFEEEEPPEGDTLAGS